MRNFVSKVRIYLIICLSVLGISTVSAGNQSGNITRLFAHEGDVVIVALDGTYTDQMTCNTQGEWAIPLTTESGKAMFSTLLSAASLGLPVYIHGYDVGCRLTREIPSFVLVNY